jgi:hypothetical protein
MECNPKESQIHEGEQDGREFVKLSAEHEKILYIETKYKTKISNLLFGKEKSVSDNINNQSENNDTGSNTYGRDIYENQFVTNIFGIGRMFPSISKSFEERYKSAQEQQNKLRDSLDITGDIVEIANRLVTKTACLSTSLEVLIDYLRGPCPSCRGKECTCFNPNLGDLIDNKNHSKEFLVKSLNSLIPKLRNTRK